MPPKPAESLLARTAVKLIVQIPCHNEARTLPLVVQSIPRSIPGVDLVEVLVIDDGSTDGTGEVARSLAVEHIVRHAGRRGLAATFRDGLDTCLRLGADIVVNTDGDNQYNQSDIPELVRPILEGRADMVVGDRQTRHNAHFSARKRLLQALGSWFVRLLSGTRVPDAPSGFRAFSRQTAQRLNVVSSYSYTLETLLQAGAERMAIAFVPVGTNPAQRRSRLFHSVFGYVKASAATLLRTYAMYQPLKVFLVTGGLVFAGGLAVGARFVYFYFTEGGSGHVQSLVLAAVLLIVGFQIGLIGLLADLIAANRRLLEDALYRIRRLEGEAVDRAEPNGHPEIHHTGSGRALPQKDNVPADRR